MKKSEFDLFDLIEKHMIQFGLLPEHGSDSDEDIDIDDASDEPIKKELQN